MGGSIRYHVQESKYSIPSVRRERQRHGGRLGPAAAAASARLRTLSFERMRPSLCSAVLALIYGPPSPCRPEQKFVDLIAVRPAATASGDIPHPNQMSEGQCSTVTPSIGKSATLAVASDASIPAAAAAIRQSAWWRVIPRSANCRRHVPALMPSAVPSGATRRPLKRRWTTGSSAALTPRQISSIEIAHTHGSVPVRRSAATRPAAARPRRASISTVESSSSRDIYPVRRESRRRCARTHAAGSSSHSCPVSGRAPRALSMSSHRCSSSSPRRMSSAMNALRRRGPTLRSSSPISSSSSAMCNRMGLE